MDSIDQQRAGAIALGRILGYRPKAARLILETLGSTREVFLMDSEARRRLLGPGCDFAELLSADALREAERELEWLHREGYRYIYLEEEAYPAALRECPDPPIGLYLRSAAPPEEVFSTARSFVAVVGTRDASPYGTEWCRRVVKGFAEADPQPCIVSGLALGIDSCAHQAALDADIPTIGVSPVGIDEIYPRRHREMACRIVAARGSAVVSDFPPCTRAVAMNFLRRNRIIAGLSRATVVVESKPKGGSMLTARLAADYSRDVFAIPGRLSDQRSQGCLTLIGEKVAEPVVNLPSLCASLGLGRLTAAQEGPAAAIARTFGTRLSPEDLSRMQSLAAAVASAPGSNFDELSRAAGLEYRQTVRLCTLMENEGLLRVDILQRCTPGW